MNLRVLLADDDASLRFVLSQALSKEGFQVRATSNVATLLRWVKEGEGDVVLSDVYMGDESVFDALPAMRTARPDLPFIVMSAQSTVATALSAAQAGAFDYLPKPFDLDALIAMVRRACERTPDPRARAAAKLAGRNENLPLIGKSAPMQEVYRILARAARTDLPVLIEGESGTGKARVARALHDHSARAAGPFLALSLAGASATELDAELFSADGKLAQARGGTLLLKDLDALPPETQVRLAGRLPSQDDDQRPQTRVLASAQRSLAALTRESGFRVDLLNRLNVLTLRIPPLRERMDDLPDLARSFLLRAKREGLPEKMLSAAAVTRLQQHEFPGNVRELENVLRRAAALAAGAVISPQDIEGLLERTKPARAEPGRQAGGVAELIEDEFAEARPGTPEPGLYDRLLARLEAPLIQRTLAATGGNQIRAAAILGINRNTLRKKIQAQGLGAGSDD
jgi:two-component system, NtrC family, nitrogen regulation response regulator GlnG